MSGNSGTSGVRSILGLIAGLAVLAAVVTPVLAYPKPAAVPYRWELDFTPGPLRLYVDELEGRAYWYFTYEAINRTGRDRIWAPELTIFTDSGEILRSGEGVPSHVTEDVLALLDDELLESQNEIIGDLLQGKENGREGLVLWPAKSLQVNELSLFIRGISGESTRIPHPLEAGQQITLHKTLQLDYLIPGDMMARGSKPVEVVDTGWVMR